MLSDDGNFVDPDRIRRNVNFCGQDLAAQVRSFVRLAVKEGPIRGLLREHTSFGGVVTYPVSSQEQLRLLLQADDPYRPVWFGFGWGHERNRYIANALRKLPPTLHALRDSLDLARDPGYSFSNPVDSQDGSGRFPMGTFPYGGAKIVHIGGLWIAAAVSALNQIEDDAIAGATGLFTGCQVLKNGGDKPLDHVSYPHS